MVNKLKENVAQQQAWAEDDWNLPGEQMKHNRQLQQIIEEAIAQTNFESDPSPIT